MIVQKSLHKRYNRNNARKCFQNTSTAKILCTDASRSIRKANDWTFACLVNYSGVTDLASLYCDYDTLNGIFIGLDSVNSVTETYVRIISREATVGTATYYNLGSILENRWISIIASYNSTLNEITVYCNGEDVGTQSFSATVEWATNTEFSMFSLPPNFGNTSNMEGLCSSYCILDKQADAPFIEEFNTFGTVHSTAHTNVTFFTDFSKINPQGTYTGIECSSRFYNRLGTTTKEIRFEGFTNAELGLDTFNNGISPNCLIKGYYEEDRELEDQFGLDMGRTFYKTHPTPYDYVANLRSGTTVPTLDWTNGYTVVAKGNWTPQEVGNFDTSPVIWFNSEVIDMRIINSNEVAVRITPSGGGAAFFILNTVHKIDAHNVYTLTVNPIGGGQADYILYINGEQVATDTQEYRNLDPAPTLNNRFIFGTLVSGLNVRYAKYHSAMRIYDGVLTPTQCKSVLGSELDTYSPLCKFTTNLDGSGNLIDDTGNLNNTTKSSGSLPMTEDLVVEVASGFQPRRKGLNFIPTASNEEYIQIANLPQIDLNVGITIIAVINDFSNAIERNYIWFDDFDAIDNVIRHTWRRNQSQGGSLTSGDKYLGFNSSTAGGTEIFFLDNEGTYSTTSVYRVSNQTIEAPKYKASRIGTANERQDTRTYTSVRTGATYNLYLAGQPALTNNYPTNQQYTDITFEGFMLVNGILGDDEVNEIVSKGKFNNPTKEIMEKYDFEVIVDFNRAYDDGGTIKLYDLSGNEHDILPISDAGLSWQTVGDVENSQTDL
jgi:hypothetical protein